MQEREVYRIRYWHIQKQIFGESWKADSAQSADSEKTARFLADIHYQK